MNARLITIKMLAFVRDICCILCLLRTCEKSMPVTEKKQLFFRKA